MIRLAGADLRAGAAVWVGALLVAIAAGAAASIPVSLVATGLRTPGAPGLALLSLAGTSILFTALAVVAVLGAVLRLSVLLRVRTFALWQLIGVPPRLVGGVVLTEILLLGVIGGAVGVAAGASFAPAVLRYGSTGTTGLDGVVLRSGTTESIVGVAAIAAVTVLAAVPAARRASRVAPLAAFRDPDGAQRARPLRRAIAITALLAVVASMLVSLPGSVPTGAAQLLLIGPLLIATAAVAAPWVLAAALRVWRALVPRGATAFHIARAEASASRATSIAILTAALVAGGLPAAVVAGESTLRSAAGGAAPVGDPAAAVLLLTGGPALLAAVGAATIAVMSGAQRRRAQALLRASGAAPGLVLRTAALEVVITVLTGVLVAGGVIASASLLEVAVLRAAGLAAEPGSALPVLVGIAAGVLSAVLIAVTGATARGLRRSAAEALRRSA